MQEAREALSLFEDMGAAAWTAFGIAAVLAINELRIRHLERVYQAERRNWWRF